MFKNGMIYRVTSAWTYTVATLEDALQTNAFVPCSGSQEKSIGWIAPRGQEHGALVEVIDGQWIMKFSVESKLLPSSVVKRHAEEKLAGIEATTGRKPGKKEKREILEDVRQSLLPLAFTKQASVTVWIDPKNHYLLLDAGSTARADEVMTGLIKAIDGLAVELINTQTSPSAAMAHWLSSKEAPVGFSVDRECELKAADESKAVVRYARHPLDTDEVCQHIASGKMPTRLALTWNDQLSFVLTEGLALKKISLTDTALESSSATAGDTGADNFDTDVVLITGTLRKMLPELIEALGGVAPLTAT